MTKNDEEPRQPDWPINVLIFGPDDSVADILRRIAPTQDPILKYRDDDGTERETHASDHHFSTKRYALLFRPGVYEDCAFEVGYYVQMAGLGRSATDVRFAGNGSSGPFVPALNKQRPVTPGGSIPYPNAGLCLDTFWRSAENFCAQTTQWAVSQAAPLRRVAIGQTLVFGDGGAYASGGFLANASVGGSCDYVANQQWCSRNAHFGDTAKGGAWSTVFAGCTGGVPPAGAGDGDLVVTVVETPQIRMEKPFVVENPQGNYELHVPRATTKDTTGSCLGDDDDDEAYLKHTEIRCFSNVKVAKPILPLDEDGNYAEHDDATYNEVSQADIELTEELQTALDDGKDLVLCPGIYFLSAPLVIRTPHQVVLGLGLATLVAPQNGAPCIRVLANTPGVRIAGIVLEASVQSDEVSSEFGNSDGIRSLLDFGEPHRAGDGDPGDAQHPGLLADVFCRVGGSNLDRSVRTDAMVRVFAGNVLGDNLWLWRADHVRLRPGEAPNDPKLDYHQVRTWAKAPDDGSWQRVDECPVDHALVVEGHHVSMIGLFCEHTLQDQVVWKGHHGRVVFFQSELPYDVRDFDGHTGYRVCESVTHHDAHALGVYSNFTCFDVSADHGVCLPSHLQETVHSPFCVFLNGYGEIASVVQMGPETTMGDAVNASNKLSRGWIGQSSHPHESNNEEARA